MKNLIMGLWSRGTFEGLEPFIGSLRRTSFDGDVCIFVDAVAPETVEALLSHGILVERLSRLPTPPMNDQSSRYFNYLDFLTRNGDRYANVMLSDLRDVVFQSDPFAQPLPAELVFAQERCVIGESPVNRQWVIEVYGEEIAHNLRDCPISCSGTTFGTVAGMLRYLAAMTTELAGLLDRNVLHGRGLDQAVHNYIIRMRPLRDAWVDAGDSLVATMYYVPEQAISIAPQGALIDGRLVPIVHQWDSKEATRNYVRSASQFSLTAAQRGQRPSPAASASGTGGEDVAERRNAVLAFYHRPRDADWLLPFLRSLRCVGYLGDIHCVGSFDDNELQLLSQLGCRAHPVISPDAGLDVENIAHLFFNQVLDQLATDDAAKPGQVLVLDSVRAGFLRDPFHAQTDKLSVFLETATRLGESEFNLQRVTFFTEASAELRDKPIVSSAVLRGPLDVMRAFYRKLFIEFVGRAELLRIHKAIQGAVNKLCHGPEAPTTIIHPNGSEAYFEIWEGGLPVTTQPAVRVAGAVPFAVLNPVRETELMYAVRAQLGLA